MRIGVVMPRQPATVGGGHTFHETVVRALTNVPTDHEFILLDSGGFGYSVGSGLPLVDVKALAEPKAAGTPEISATDLAAQKLGLDAVWYLDHMAEVLAVPVFATVLDLAHRQHPFFPEVSHAGWGWGWEARESHYRQVLPRAARIFVGTPTGKAQVMRCYGVHADNIVVNPFPVPALAAKDNPACDEEILGRHELQAGFLFYPAQFWPHKNHVTLLLALQHLKLDYGLEPSLVLTGADKGNLGHVLQLAEDLNLKQQVRYLGFIPGGDLPALYRNAAAMVFPTFFGPDNLPPLEAFSFDCPVLASRIEGVEDQLTNNAAGFFDPTRPEEIAALIARVLSEDGYKKGLIRNGRAIAAARTPEAYVRAVLCAFDEFVPWRSTWAARPLRPPSAISQFPEDLGNAALLHTGFFEDGWVAQNCSLVLCPGRQSHELAVRGEIPAFKDARISLEMTISLNGQLLRQVTLGVGHFEVSVVPPKGPAWKRIDIGFSDTQKLPDPDWRTIGAKLEYVGFSERS